MTPSRPIRRRVAAMLTVLTVALGALTAATTPPTPAEAAVNSGWDPGYIISDALFYDSGSMNTADIDSFLRSMGASCVAGERACLKDYTETTRDWASEPGICAGYQGRAGEGAAQIIAKAAASCGISPKVLLVVLQKESSLVTKSRPTARNYEIPMGFGCPDGAPCNAEYYGFSNQVYRAARQFKIYAAHSTRYSYQAGRSNYIQYNPNAACGGSNVYIRNQATASLYIYTPYQPNDPALSNLYGSGDGCSAYGNRNFWRLYTDWFGDPHAGGFFIKTSTDSAVYLVVDAQKYTVPDMSIYQAYSSLGPIATVSTAQVNGYPTAGTLGRFVRNPSSGTIYFVDYNTKLHAETCQIIADYGSSCAGAINLNVQQLNTLTTGPALTNAYVTVEWKQFYVTGGTRREVFDTPSLAAAGLPTANVRLTEGGIANLPYGAPIIRDSVILRDRTTAARYLYIGGSLTALPEPMSDFSGFRSLPQQAFDGPSVRNLGAPNAMGSAVRSSDGGPNYLVTSGGLVSLSAAALGATPAVTTLPGTLISALPRFNGGDGAVAVKTPSDATVRVLANGRTRVVPTWGDLLDTFGGQAPPVFTITDSTMASFAPGPAIPAAGTLVKAADSPTIYLVSDGRRLIPVESFDTTEALGIRGWSTVDRTDLSAYAIDSSPLTVLLACADGYRAGIGSTTYALERTEAGPKPSTTLGARACAALPRAAGTLTGPLFVRDPSASTVYRVVAGTLRPVTSWTALVTMSGSSVPHIYAVTPAILAAMPLGQSMS